MNFIVVNESKMRRTTVQAKLPLVQMAVRRSSAGPAPARGLFC